MRGGEGGGKEGRRAGGMDGGTEGNIHIFNYSKGTCGY